MKNLKTVLESKLGTISDIEFNFAFEHIAKNIEQGEEYVEGRFEDLLDDMSMGIDFYRQHYEQKRKDNDRKKFIFREVTRDGGSLEKAYHVSRESLTLALRQVSQC